MRPGGGSKKGGAYERKLARALSTWWYGDKNRLWRRPGSGYRSAMPDRHTGDIVPIADHVSGSGGAVGSWPFHVEAKCYAKSRLKLNNLLWPKRNPIRKIWKKALAERRKDLVPLLILKCNNTDPVAVMYDRDLRWLIANRSALDAWPTTFVTTQDEKGRTVIIFPWLEVQNQTMHKVGNKK